MALCANGPEGPNFRRIVMTKRKTTPATTNDVSRRFYPEYKKWEALTYQGRTVRFHCYTNDEKTEAEIASLVLEVYPERVPVAELCRV